jgi:hypothetical protein
MALPGVIQTIEDNGLGLVPVDNTRTRLKLGVCSSGSVNTLYSFSDKTLMRATLGQGPLVEALAHDLDQAGGPVYAMRLTGSVAGTAGSVTATATGTGTVTVSGAPYDSYSAIVEITRNGTNIAAGTAAFVYSLDGGDTYSSELAVPTGGTYAVPNSGITLTFVNGGSGTSFVDGDRHTFTTTAPGYSTTNIADAMTVLKADARTWAFAHLVGATSAASGTATVVAAMQTHAGAFETAFRYIFFIVEGADDTDSNFTSAFANVVAPRVVMVPGYTEMVSAISGNVYKRSAAWAVATRIAKQDIRRDPGRVRSDTEGGSLPGVVSLYRDENATPGLSDLRMTTLRTIPGLPGFYITSGRTLAALGSDYSKVQHRRIMDRACQLNYEALVLYINDDSVRVDPSTGYIDERDARAIENSVNARLTAELTARGRVTATQVVVKRDTNILSNSTLYVSVRVIPKGYSEFIQTDIGFTNPALALPAAA